MTKLNDHKYQIIQFKGITYLVPYDEFLTLAKFINEQDYTSAECLLLISDRVVDTSQYTFLTIQGDVYYE